MTAPSQTLLEENRRLRERLSELERKMFSLPELTPQENRIAAVLYEARGPMTRDAICAEIYGDRDSWPGTRTVDQLISRMRAKLAPLGVAIHSKRGEGYSFDTSARARIEELRELAS